MKDEKYDLSYFPLVAFVHIFLHVFLCIFESLSLPQMYKNSRSMGYDLAQNHRQFDYSVFQRSFENRRVASCRIVSWRTGNDVKVHPGAKERSNQRVSVPLAVWFRSTQSPWLVVGSDSIEEIVPRQSRLSIRLCNRT